MEKDEVKDIVESFFTMLSLSLEIPIKLEISQKENGYSLKTLSKTFLLNRNDEIIYFDDKVIKIRTYKVFLTKKEYNDAVRKAINIIKLPEQWVFTFKVSEMEEVMKNVMIFENYYRLAMT